MTDRLHTFADQLHMGSRQRDEAASGPGAIMTIYRHSEKKLYRGCTNRLKTKKHLELQNSKCLICLVGRPGVEPGTC